jgi:hypothetical protein
MAHLFGSSAFDFCPETYVLPAQVEQFLECYGRTSHLWIVKPHASSRGRGIFLLRDLGELPLDELSVVCRYVDNPLLIQGLKFDLRVYVLVTSFDPLRAYVYREGLARFASKPYSTLDEHLQDAYRHLTNYSINKSASNFVENAGLDADNVGHKWSLSALNKHLKCVGIDVKLMWSRINDVILKTLLSVAPTISQKSRELGLGKSNCFELYGFDVLVDNALKPWLLEVNLSPSMMAESPLDWQVKSSLLCDTFHLVGPANVDRSTLQMARMRVQMAQNQQRRQAAQYPHIQRPPQQQPRPGVRKNGVPPAEGPAAFRDIKIVDRERPIILDSLCEAQLKMLAQSLEEHGRCRNFIKLYPTPKVVERYACITEARTLRPQAKDMDRLLRGCRLSPTQLLASVIFGPRPIRSAADLPPQPAAQAQDRRDKEDRESERRERPKRSHQSLSQVGRLPDDSTPKATCDNPEESPSGRKAKFDSTAPSLASTGTGIASSNTSVDPEDQEDERGSDNDDRRSEEAEVEPKREEAQAQGLVSDAAQGGPNIDGGSEPEGETIFAPTPVPVDPIVSQAERRRSLQCVERSLLDLGAEAGCRIVLMEYLKRVSNSCDMLGTLDRAKLAQSAAYARFSGFQHRLEDANEMSQKGLRVRSDSSDSLSSSCSTGGCGGLVDELASSCRRSLRLIERQGWAREGRKGLRRRHREGSAQDTSDDDSDSSGSSSSSSCRSNGGTRRSAGRDNGGLLRRGQGVIATNALRALSNLSAVELEQFLRGPFCADEFKALLGPFQHGSGGDNAEFSSGPLSELLRAGRGDEPLPVDGGHHLSHAAGVRSASTGALKRETNDGSRGEVPGRQRFGSFTTSCAAFDPECLRQKLMKPAKSRKVAPPRPLQGQGFQNFSAGERCSSVMQLAPVRQRSFAEIPPRPMLNRAATTPVLAPVEVRTSR